MIGGRQSGIVFATDVKSVSGNTTASCAFAENLRYGKSIGVLLLCPRCVFFIAFADSSIGRSIRRAGRNADGRQTKSDTIVNPFRLVIVRVVNKLAEYTEKVEQLDGSIWLTSLNMLIGCGLLVTRK